MRAHDTPFIIPIVHTKSSTHIQKDGQREFAVNSVRSWHLIIIEGRMINYLGQYFRNHKNKEKILRKLSKSRNGKSIERTHKVPKLEYL